MTSKCASCLPLGPHDDLHQITSSIFPKRLWPTIQPWSFVFFPCLLMTVINIFLSHHFSKERKSQALCYVLCKYLDNPHNYPRGRNSPHLPDEETELREQGHTAEKWQKKDFNSCMFNSKLRAVYPGLDIYQCPKVPTKGPPCISTCLESTWPLPAPSDLWFKSEYPSPCPSLILSTYIQCQQVPYRYLKMEEWMS